MNVPTNSTWVPHGLVHDTRPAFLSRHTRVRRLEAERDQQATISSAQRGHIYQLVQIWADARVEHQGIAPGAARAGCWAALKTRFKLSRYEDLPAAKYHECIAFVRDAYQAITGESLTGDQLTMDV